MAIHYCGTMPAIIMHCATSVPTLSQTSHIAYVFHKSEPIRATVSHELITNR